MIVIVQHHEGLELQEAVDYVGDLCYGCIDRFEALRRALPSWGPEIDRQLRKAIAVAEQAQEVIPHAIFMNRLIPDDFGNGCREIFGTMNGYNI